MPIELMAKGKQTTVNPGIMSHWGGFFDPQIVVESTIDDAKVTLRPNECKYIFPTYAYGFIQKCPDIVNHANRDCMCARQIVTCVYGVDTFTKLYENDLSLCGGAQKDNYKAYQVCFDVFTRNAIALGQNLDCYPIPLAPPPPPFCEQFEPAPEIKIVPDLSSTYFKPKLKFLVGNFTNKECNDGKRIPLVSTCSDGSAGKPITPTSYVATASTGNNTTIITIKYAGKDFTFGIKQSGKQVCGMYYLGGNSGKLINVKEICYDKPAMSKPTNLTLTKANTVQFNIPGFASNPITLSAGSTHAATGLRAFKPKIDATRTFQAEATCINNDGKTKKINTSTDNPCESGYKLKFQYTQSDSNVVCIAGWDTKNKQYILKRGSSRFVFQDNPTAFIPHRYNKATREWIAQTTSPIHSYNTSQSVLDSMRITGTNLFQITSPSGNTQNSYKYQQLVLPVTNNSDPLFPNDLVGETTNFSLLSGQPLQLTATEIANVNFQYYRPVDPFLQSLCVPNFGFVDYTTINTPHEFIVDGRTNNCDFITLEAWGGGGAGHIFDNPKEPLIAKYGSSFSGATGNYSKATLNMSSQTKKAFKAVVGAGARNGFSNAGESVISLCEEDRSILKHCVEILKASGAKAFGQVGNSNSLTYGDLDYITLFRGLIGQGENDLTHKLQTATAQNISSVFRYQDFPSSSCGAYPTNEGITTSVTANTNNGSGGCASREKNIWQPGANGRVKITCEKWTK